MMIPLILLLLAPLALLLLLIFAGLAKLVFGSSSRRGTANREDQMRQLERTWSLLTRMEGRIENLETILIERSRPASEAKGDPTFHA